MTGKTIQVLAAMVLVLLVLLLVLRGNDSNDAGAPGRLFIPGLKAIANTATEIRISRATANDDVTIHRKGEAWLIRERDNYPADLGKIRQLIIAMADAQIVEEKTADEQKYDRLGVNDPEDRGSGSDVSISGPGFSYSAILGNEVQGGFRYARIKGETTSYLIDQNPNIPNPVGDWLFPEIIDIDSKRVRSVSVSHAGGERIFIERGDQEQADFAIFNIPDGRELSYSTVGNGIAGALKDLQLQDVRERIEVVPSTSIVYKTRDGLVVTVEVVSADEVSWVTFSAAAVPVDIADTPTGDDVQETETSALTIDIEADEINERLSGWQFQLADYKKNLLTRRWEDILKAADESPLN